MCYAQVSESTLSHRFEAENYYECTERPARQPRYVDECKGVLFHMKNEAFH